MRQGLLVSVVALWTLMAHSASAALVEINATPVDSVFIEQEPILVLLECRNPSKTATVGCPSPDPQNGCVRLNLEAIEDSSRIKRLTTWLDTLGGPRMMRLAPTGTDVWVANILGIFGEWFTRSCRLSGAIGQLSRGKGFDRRVRGSVPSRPGSDGRFRVMLTRMAQSIRGETNVFIRLLRHWIFEGPTEIGNDRFHRGKRSESKAPYCIALESWSSVALSLRSDECLGFHLRQRV